MDKTSYRVLNLTVVCMFLLSTAAQQAFAWPCTSTSCPPPCYICTPTGCENDCGPGCYCVDDECVCCWTLETSDPFQYGGCYCDDTVICEGEVQTGYHHSCRLASSGSKECVYRLNQPIGWTWDCEATPNYCGAVVCWLSNTGVCYLQCNAAWMACAAMCVGMGGVPECVYAAQDCWNCLIGEEGIDCGCLVITCVPSDTPSGTYYGGDNILQGGSCP